MGVAAGLLHTGLCKQLLLGIPKFNLRIWADFCADMPNDTLHCPYLQVAEVLSQLAALVAAVALPEPEQPAAEEAEAEAEAEKEGGEGEEAEEAEEAEGEAEAEEKPAPKPVPSAAEQKDAVGGCCLAAWSKAMRSAGSCCCWAGSLSCCIHNTARHHNPH
jgi:hypothetical protein